MNYKKVSKSLRKIADKTLTQDDLAEQIIIQKGKEYHAYGNYVLEETPAGWQVTSKMLSNVILFNTAKVALAWCIAHKVGQFKLATMLRHLDSRVTAKQYDIDMLTYMLDNSTQDSDARAILTARLVEDIDSRQSCKKQLAKCIESAKYIKLRN